MKKIFAFAIAVSFFLGATAQNELQVIPCRVKAEGSFVLVNLNNPDTENKIQNFELYIQWPKGWTIGKPNISHADVSDRTTEYDEDQEAYILLLTGDATNLGDNLFKYAYYASNLEKPLKGKKGAILRIKITPPEGIADGYYPIKLIGGGLDETSFMSTSGDKGSEIWFDTQVSYVVVGNPTNASLTMEGVIPSFVNDALKDETSITNLDLSAVTAVNGTFTYVDGRAVTAPADENVKADKAVYSRTVSEGNYTSLKAPFTATGCSNLYTLDNNSDNLGSEWVNFTEATTIAAGDDLLAQGSIALSGENVKLGDVAAAHTEDDVYYVKGGRFYRGNKITINPLRTCWSLQGGNSNLMIAIDGEPTGIALNTIDGLDTPTYDLQGRRSENAQHGIFVTNGKKQIIK